MFFCGGMLLFWLLVIGVVVAALSGLGVLSGRPRADGGETPTSTRATPEEILQSRYVRGEISREEYEQMRATLQS
jgi:putative membrane protein